MNKEDEEILDELVKKAKRYEAILSVKEKTPDYIAYEEAKANFKDVVNQCKQAGLNWMLLTQSLVGEAQEMLAGEKKIRSIYNEKEEKGKEKAKPEPKSAKDSIASVQKEMSSFGKEATDLFQLFLKAMQVFVTAHYNLFSKEKALVDEYHGAKKGAKTGPDMGYVKFLKAHAQFLKDHKKEVDERFEKEHLTHPKVGGKAEKAVAKMKKK